MRMLFLSAVRVRTFNAGTFLIKPQSVPVPNLLASLRNPICLIMDSTHFDDPDGEAMRAAIAARGEVSDLWLLDR